MYNINDDGVLHINVYTKGKTQLGRDLSNLSNIGFNHPKYGRFISMEGFWYWVKTGKKHNVFRTLYGFYAKKQGKEFATVLNHEFENIIKEGLECKIKQNPELLVRFKDSTLPFTHYYTYGDRIVIPKGGNFQLTFLEDLRNKLKEPT
jgi:hypothetical protein